MDSGVPSNRPTSNLDQFLKEIMPGCSTDNPWAGDTLDPELWAAARRELLGFASHLHRSKATITAGQIRMAVARGDLLGVGAAEEILCRVKELEHKMNQILKLLEEKSPKIPL